MIKSVLKALAVAGALATVTFGVHAANTTPDNVRIGAASVGGTYYVWATGFAKLVSSKVETSANVEVTGGPLHNIQLVNGGEMTFGLSTAAPAYEGFNGTEWAKGKKFDNIRGVIPMFPSYFHWWALEKSGIKSIQDLNGKVVAMGPKGGTPDTYGRRLFDTLGIKPARLVNAGFSDIVGQLRDGLVDAAFTTSGIPHPSVMENESTQPLNIFGVSQADADKFIEKYPYFSTDVIPQATYKSLKGDLLTLTVWNFLIANKDTSPDFVYKVTKAAIENVDILIETHRSSKDVKLENAVKLTVPMHAGALKYFREKGITVPDKLVPPEAK
ncbi:MAG: TAXI family TRAP transporter solute-binding subunit [Hyphomicrobiales bacterium]